VVFAAPEVVTKQPSDILPTRKPRVR
jgi:hypothetical protein